MSARRPVLTALLALGLLTACAPGPLEDAATEQEYRPMDPEDFAGLTLSYMYFTDGPDEQATRDLIADFEEAYDVTVELEVLPYADLVTATLNRLSAGDPPDVVRLTGLTDFAGELLQLEPYLGDDYGQEFESGPMSAVLDTEGRMVAVPSDLTMNGPFVNVDLFEEAGVEIPAEWTWEEMLAAAAEVRERTGAAYSYAMDKSGHRLSTVLSEYSTFLLDANGNALDPAGAQEALQPLVDMMAADTMPADFWLGSGSRYEGANEIFLAGQTPIYLSGNWQIGQFAENATFDWAVAPNPCALACGGFPGGKFMASFEQTEHPALAAEFIRFMNTTQAQEEFVAGAGALPTRVDLTARGVSYADEQMQEAMDVFLADLQVTPDAGFASNGHPASAPVNTALVDAIALVVAGELTLPEALAELDQEIDSIVAETVG